MTDTEALLEVILVGLVAGVGLMVIFSLTIAETVRATTAHREGRRRATALHGAAATITGLMCIGAVVLAIVLMLHK